MHPVFGFVLVLALAFIPASIASNKGYSAVVFYFFGLFFFLPALIVALLLAPKRSAQQVPSAPGASPGPTGDPAAARPGLGLAPGPGVVRECPH